MQPPVGAGWISNKAARRLLEAVKPRMKRHVGCAAPLTWRGQLLAQRGARRTTARLARRVNSRIVERPKANWRAKDAPACWKVGVSECYDGWRRREARKVTDEKFELLRARSSSSEAALRMRMLYILAVLTSSSDYSSYF